MLAAMDRKQSRPPIVLDRAFDDPDSVLDLVARGGPYWSVQRYLKNASEMASLSQAGKGRPAEAPMLVAPWFRGDLAFGAPLVSGVEQVLANERFADAAERLFGLPRIVPHQVYVNLNPPMPQVDPGHVDIPTFLGVDRSTTPVWLLAIMLKSGLFDAWYVPTATAVAWLYGGVGGGFRYWPEGPDRSPIDRACVTNSAIVGDNDRMFHCVPSIGEAPTLVRGMTLDSKLHYGRDAAFVMEGDRELGRWDAKDIRLSISWKAFAFPDEAAEARFRRGADDADALTLDRVVRIFLADLAARGLDASEPSDPLDDRAFTDRLNATYAYSPTVFR